MHFVVTRDAASGLWGWELTSEGTGPLARSGTQFETKEELLDDLRRIRVEAPRSLVFGPLGVLYEGA